MNAQPRKPVSAPSPIAPAVNLGLTANGAPFGLGLPELLDGRLLIQGVSGAGKSWLLRRLLEQSLGSIQQLVIDPEGEFKSLAESADIPVIDATRLDGVGYARLGARVREQRTSIVLDVSQLEREGQMQAVAGFMRALVESPREHWHPALVAIDEAHLFAPFGGQGAESSYMRRTVTTALVDLMSRGRKRGLATVIATQRLARLSKSVASEATNFLVGHNVLDLDMRRAAEFVGFSQRRASEVFPTLRPGHFVAAGSAFNVSPAIVTVGPVRSKHLGSTPAMSAPPLPSAQEAEELLGIDDLSDADAAENRQPANFRAIRSFLADRGSPLAARIVRELVPFYPDGLAIRDLRKHIGVDETEFATAIEVLERYNAIFVDGTALRLERGMAVICKR